jgi:hypothetical protein
MIKCTRCGQLHTGTMMRTDRRYTRVRDLINEEVPKMENGQLKFCHLCQRSVYFAGGVNQMLVADLKRAITQKIIGRNFNADLIAHARRELGFNS